MAFPCRVRSVSGGTTVGGTGARVVSRWFSLLMVSAMAMGTVAGSIASVAAAPASAAVPATAPSLRPAVLDGDSAPWSWTEAETPPVLPSDESDPKASGVSCPTASVCYQLDAGMNESTGEWDSFVITVTNGVPGSPQLVGSNGGGSYEDLTCASLSTCYAATTTGGPGQQAVVVTLTNDNGTFSATTTVVSSLTLIRGFSCPTTSVCYGVGADNDTGSSNGGDVFTLSGGSVSGVHPVAGTGALWGIACESASTCFAVGATEEAGVGEAAMFPVTSGTPGSGLAIPEGNEFGAVSCGSSTTCYALIPSVDSENAQAAIIVPIVGGVLGQPQSAPPGNLFTLSCPSAAECLSSGNGAFDVFVDGVAEPIQSATLYALTCPSVTACLGMDQNGTLYEGTGPAPDAPGEFSFGVAGGGAALHDPGCTSSGDPVNCITGDFWQTYTDVSVPGLGVGLDLTRTYNSFEASTLGMFGYGWSSSYEWSLSEASGDTSVTITESDGSQATATSNGGGGWVLPTWTGSSLTQNANGTWSFVCPKDVTYTFDAAGQLTAITDRNGYTTSLAYNGSGQLSTVTDASGRQIAFSYGSNGLVSQVEDPAGNVTKYGYTSDDLTSVTDPLDRETQFGYGTGNLLLTIEKPDDAGTLANQYYPSSDQIEWQIDPAGLKTTWAYSGDPFSAAGGTTTVAGPHGEVEVEQYVNGEMTSLTEGPGTADPRTWTYTYDPVTLGAMSVTDPDHDETQFWYDANGNLVKEVDALGRTTTWVYNSFDEPTSETDPAGIATTWVYDGHGNLQTETVVGVGGSPSVESIYTDGDSSLPGYPTKVQDPDGNITNFTYDSYRDVTSTTTHPSSSTTDESTAQYNVLGEEVCAVSAKETAAGVSCPAIGQPRVAGTQTWGYDDDGELQSATDADGNTTDTIYTADGMPTLVVDPSSDLTFTTYDADDRPVSVTTGTGSSSATTTTYAYDIAPGTGSCSSSVPNVAYCTTSTDGLGTTTDYYDVFDELIESAPPNSSAEAATSYGYFANGQLETEASGSGTTTYGYDADDELQSVSYSATATGYQTPANVSYTYEPDGQVETMTDGTGETTYGYDSLGQLSSETDGAQATVTYGYDPDGNVTCMSYPVSGAATCPATSGAGIVTYAYDGVGEMKSVSDWQGDTSEFSYDPDGDETQDALANGVTATQSYDPADLLQSVSDAPASQPSDTLASFSYSYPSVPADELVSQTQSTGVPGIATQTFGYDAAQQLTSTTTGSFSYDDAQDATSLPGTPALTYNADHQLCWSGATSGACGSAPAGATTYGYNSDGDLTSTAQPAGGGAAYGYNQADQLTSVTPTVSSSRLAVGTAQTVEIDPQGTVSAWGQIPGNGSSASTTPVAVPGLSDIVSVAAGLQTAYALSASGVVYAWGSNSDGEVGAGCSGSSCSTPEVVSGLPSNVTAIAAGALSGYALTATGQVYAWGANNTGQLGTGCSGSECAIPVEVAGLPSGVTQISAGGIFWGSALALTSSGHVYGWGYDNAGQLGTGCTSSQCATPVEVAGLPSDITEVSEGGEHSLALTASGSVYAWGSNSDDQLGSQCTTSQCATPAAVTGLNYPAVAVSATLEDSYVVDSGEVQGWGEDADDEVGSGGVTTATPVNLQSLPSGTLGVGGSAEQMAVIEPDGATVAWGAGGNGQIGDDSTTDVASPTPLGALSQPVSEGWLDTVALRPDGSVWAWGDDNAGQAGPGCTQSECTTPVQVTGVSDVTAVASAVSTNYALESNGTLWAWGYGADGELGDGATSNSSTPVQVQLPSGTDVVAVAAGWDFAEALTSTGKVYAWGIDTSDQLGNSAGNSATPEQIGGLPSGVVSITATGTTGLVLTSAGTVYGWGDDSDKQLGTGCSTSTCATPVQIAGLSQVTAIAGGGDHALALTTAGVVKAWGYDASGQLGANCSGSTCATPVTVSGVGNTVTAITAGYDSSFAYGPDGGVFGWGDNTGDELTSACAQSSCSTPVSILTGTAPTAMASGSFGFTPVAEAPDGELQAWGGNYDGELGNGTTTNAATPIEVATLTPAFAGNAYAASYTYNGDGLLTTATDNGYTQKLTWGAAAFAGQPLLLQYGSGDIIYGPGGAPVEDLENGTTPTYYLTDGQGSVRALTNQAGTITTTYTYSTTGQLTAIAGSGALAALAYNPLGYTGAYQDVLTGLTYLINRWYDPATAQFLTVDPAVAQTGTPYAYANDDPVNETDPTGMVASSWWRDIVDVPQDAAYLEYWGSYEAIKGVNSLANYCGPATDVCSVVTHTVTAPLVPLEAIGLAEDTLGNVLKGENIWQEGQPGQPLFGNEPGGKAISKWVGCELGTNVPNDMTFPGLRVNGTIDFAW